MIQTLLTIAILTCYKALCHAAWQENTRPKMYVHQLGKFLAFFHRYSHRIPSIIHRVFIAVLLLQRCSAMLIKFMPDELNLLRLDNFERIKYTSSIFSNACQPLRLLSFGKQKCKKLTVLGSITFLVKNNLYVYVDLCGILSSFASVLRSFVFLMITFTFPTLALEKYISRCLLVDVLIFNSYVIRFVFVQNRIEKFHCSVAKVSIIFRLCT